MTAAGLRLPDFMSISVSICVPGRRPPPESSDQAADIPAEDDAQAAVNEGKQPDPALSRTLQVIPVEVILRVDPDMSRCHGIEEALHAVDAGAPGRIPQPQHAREAPSGGKRLLRELQKPVCKD